MRTKAQPAGIHRRTQFVVTDDLLARLNRRVDRQGENDCWPWLGATRNGYGAIKHDRKVLSTHVVVYVAFKGMPPRDRIVTHSCDNKICCNPNHLVLGTFASNVQEMYERRRISAHRGSECPQAKLTEEIVVEIWERKRLTSCGTSRIAREMGIDRGLVKGVLEFKTWKHLIPDWARRTEAVV